MWYGYEAWWIRDEYPAFISESTEKPCSVAVANWLVIESLAYGFKIEFVVNMSLDIRWDERSNPGSRFKWW